MESTLSADPNAEKIDFLSNGELTLGIEIELQIIDNKSLDLVPASEAILKDFAGNNKLKQEFFLHTFELNTAICDNIHIAKNDLDASFEDLLAISKKLQIDFSATGTHPTALYQNGIITSGERYQKILNKFQWLTKRISTYSMHIHLGMPSGDSCILYNNFFLYFLPHILALSASSPFWQGIDTGLASCRPSAYEAIPTSGSPYLVNSWREFEKHILTLKKSQSINCVKDLWWDIRPSPDFGTLEIRICDGVATFAETFAICAFIHVLSFWFKDNQKSFSPPQQTTWQLRENKWRAMRYGLDARILTNPYGDTKLLREDINDWLARLKPYSIKHGYQAYFTDLKNILLHGTSSQRQRKLYQTSGSLSSVTSHNIAEFYNKKPINF